MFLGLEQHGMRGDNPSQSGFPNPHIRGATLIYQPDFRGRKAGRLEQPWI
jgi:hypothetical protein